MISVKAALQIARLKRAQRAALDHMYKELEEAEKRERLEEINRRMMEDDFTTFQRKLLTVKTGVRVATFAGWKELGATVKQGERCTKVEGVAVFHRSQTTIDD